MAKIRIPQGQYLMKILYISPENTVGTLTLWKEEHERRGNHCRTLTFFKSPKNFKDDICLNLPFNFTNPKMSYLRNVIYKLYRGEDGYFKEKKGYPPIWKPEGFFDNNFLKIKDALWKPIVYKAIKDFELDKFDVYHFESGMDFFKNEDFVKKLIKKNKKIVCHYHGEDLRSRGVMPLINKVSNLNLTNELDLLDKHPDLKYLFLPFETSRFIKKTSLNKILRVGHAPTNRFYKGSEHIIRVCQKLKLEGIIEFDLIENVSNRIALKRKSKLDIFIDQIGNKGGWGYGMNSIESLSMGVCTLTEMNQSYEKFINDHPFINVNEKSLEAELRNLIKDPDSILLRGSEGGNWVNKHHAIDKVADELYEYYSLIGLKS